MFEWDEQKRLWVLQERGIDFLRVAKAMSEGCPMLTALSPRGDEERFISILPIDEKLIAAIWTLRDGETRLITARRARHGEERHYRALFS